MRGHGTGRGAAAIALAIAVGWSGSALAIEKGGTVADVSPFAAADGAAGDRTLVVDGPVYMGDVIRTGPKGLAQIHLRDDTRLVVGPNSYMTVDKFVFSGSKAQDINLNAVRGAFRFITGLSPKQAYTIKTPSATIGVRGTRFDFSIDRFGRMAIALYEGAAQLCNRRHECFTVSGTCSVALTRRFRQTQPLSPEARQALLATAFPFVDKQKRLAQPFRVDTSGCGIVQGAIITHDAAGNVVRVPIGSNASGASASFSSFSSVSAAGAVGGTSTATNNNRSGLGDGTNPGGGSSNNNASGGGSQNPGGGGGGGGNGHGHGH